MHRILTFIFQSFSAVTTDLPTGVTFGVTGETLTLTCKTKDSSLTQFAFYKNDVEVQSLSATNTYDAPDADTYHCIAATAGGSQTAATAQKVIEFKSKSFHIHHLSPCGRIDAKIYG